MARIIIDTDPGVDDAIAILLALADPSLEVVGLTTVGGNVPLARGTRNALSLLEYAGRPDVPVARGSSRPLHGKFSYSYEFHGQSGLSRRLPESRRRAESIGAVEFLATQLRTYPGQIILAALGPLTNLALLERQHPGALAQAASLVVMGGAIATPGNTTPYAEFNFHSDAVAAQATLASGTPLTLVDLAACRQVYIERASAAGLRADNRLGQLAVQLIQNWFRLDLQRERFEFYDPLALAAALAPKLLATQRAVVSVETAAGPQLAASRITAPDGPVSVAGEVDTFKFFSLMEEWLGLGVEKTEESSRKLFSW